MIVKKNTGGSLFSQTMYFRPKEIDQMCEDELRKAKLLPDTPQPIDIEFFIEKYLECTFEYKDVPDGVLGYTCFSKNGKPIIVGISPLLINDSTQTGNRRVRSTYAHEAGHCILHPILFMQDDTSNLFGQNLDFEKRQILCRDGDMKNTKSGYDGRWWEYQANCAIGGFLLPKSLVIKASEQFRKAVGKLETLILPESQREAATKHISNVFDVSLMVATIRLNKIFPAQAQEGLL